MKIVVIPGDGIGPAIMEAALKVLDRLDVGLGIEQADAGLSAQEKGYGILPEATVHAIRTHGVALKGPLTTPVGEGFASANVLLRKTFDLYASVRPALSLPGVAAHFEGVNLTVVRENTEGLYIGREHYTDPTEGAAEAIAQVTRAASQRVITYAFDLARRTRRRRVCVFHKANILKLTSGLFLRVFREIAPLYPDLTAQEMIIDNACMQLVTNPGQFEVIVTTNMFGDIISDLCAGLVGGLGLAPSANIGENVAIFEAVHGSAPDIAGKNRANPTALILSMAMMLEHIGKPQAAERLRRALAALLLDRVRCTADLGGRNTTTGFTDDLLRTLAVTR